MSKCIQQPELNDFIDGKVPEARAEEIASHIDDCDVCQDTVVALSAHDDTFVAGLRDSPDRSHEASTRDPAFRYGLQRLLSSVKNKPTASVEPIPNQIGPYIIEQKLGDGGMGTVFLAQHSKLKRTVALKVLPAHRWSNAQAIARFEREMEAIGGLDHPHIVRASDAGEEQGMHYLVMEYVDGLDLSRLVRRVGPLDVADACALACQTAIGLQHAHDRGLVHRDVKPSNLILAWNTGEHRADGNPSLKILDLGLALLGDEHLREEHDVTTVGALMGTLDYMSPEQGIDSHSVDHRADIYGLGATLFKLLTGRAPYADPKYSTLMKKMTALATKAAPSLADVRPDLPKDVVNVVDRMLSRDPDDRFASAREVADALAEPARAANLGALLTQALAVEDPAPEQTSSELLRLNQATASAPHPANMHASARKGNRFGRLIALATLGAAVLLGAFTYHYVTDYGEVVIKSADPNLQVLLKQSDKVVKHIQLQEQSADEDNVEGNRRLRIRAGKYEIEVIGNNADVSIFPKELTVLRRAVAELPISQSDLAASTAAGPSPANSDDSLKASPIGPRYEGRTLRQWLEEVKYERSRAQLTSALMAMSALAQHPDNERLVDPSIEAIMILMQQFGGHPLSSQDELVERAWSALLEMPHDRVCQHIVREIEQGNHKSREFLFFLWHPTWGEFQPPGAWYANSEKLKHVFASHSSAAIAALKKMADDDIGYAVRFLNDLRSVSKWDAADSAVASSIFQNALFSSHKILRAYAVWHLAELAPTTSGLAETAKATLLNPHVQKSQPFIPYDMFAYPKSSQAIASAYLALAAIDKLGPQADALEEVTAFLNYYGDSFDLWNRQTFFGHSLPDWKDYAGAGGMGGYGGGGMGGMGGGFGGGQPTGKNALQCNFRPRIMRILASYGDAPSSVLPVALHHFHHATASGRTGMDEWRAFLESLDSSLRQPVLEVETKLGTESRLVDGFGETTTNGPAPQFYLKHSGNNSDFWNVVTLAAVLRPTQRKLGQVLVFHRNGSDMIVTPQDSGPFPKLQIIWPQQAWACVSECVQEIEKQLQSRYFRDEPLDEPVEIDLTQFAKACVAEHPDPIQPNNGMGGGMF